MKLKRTALLISFAAIAISGCSNIKFHGQFFDDISAYINGSFLDENEIALSPSEKPEKPTDVFYTVDSGEKYNLVFNDEFKVDINYEEQFMIVCSFSSIYKKEHYLKTIKLQDKKLIIECEHKKPKPKISSGYACAPYQRWCAVLMDIVEYTTLSFVGE